MFRLRSAIVSAVFIYSILIAVENCPTDSDCWGDETEWLIIQRRQDGRVNFFRKWNDYCNGFGELNGEFWIGNDKLYQLTSKLSYKLLILLEDFDGNKKYAAYSRFSVGPPSDNYRLNITGYSGNAGDSMASQNGQQFTTLDRDNDANDNPTCNCACQFRGAWWYAGCHRSNLNGLYLYGNHSTFADGMEWHSWRGYYYSMKTTIMKIALNV